MSVAALLALRAPLHRWTRLLLTVELANRPPTTHRLGLVCTSACEDDLEKCKRDYFREYPIDNRECD